MRHHSQTTLLDAAKQALVQASHRAGLARTISVLKAQMCTAAAQLGPYDHVSQHSPDVFPFVWEDIR